MNDDHDIELKLVFATAHGSITIQDSPDVGPELIEIVYKEPDQKTPTTLVLDRGDLEKLHRAIGKRLAMVKDDGGWT